MPEVLNVREVGKFREGAVYIGRPSKWGNPFIISLDEDRASVVVKYEEWLLSQPTLVAKAREELAGMDLICWCAPLACHGDVLLHLANT